LADKCSKDEGKLDMFEAWNDEAEACGIQLQTKNAQMASSPSGFNHNHDEVCSRGTMGRFLHSIFLPCNLYFALKV
jgi:hypothetical protein